MVLRILLLIVGLAFFFFVLFLVAKKRLLLRYSITWLVMAILIVLGAIFPRAVFWLSSLLGFELSSNFIFFLAICFLLVICLSLTAVISKQSAAITKLVQTNALLEERLDETARDATND